MNKVIILKGLTTVDKTIYVKKKIKKGYKYIDRNILSGMLDNRKKSWKKENLIAEMQDMLIDLSLIHGYNVVVNGSDLTIKHFEQIAMIADINKAELEVKRYSEPQKSQ